MGCPSGVFDVDGNPLTGVCGCEYICTQVSPNNDPIDEGFKDDNCDGTDGVAEKCVYVSASLGNDGTGTGTRATPVQTIAKALQVAQTNGVPSVCLSGETYNEAVTVISGINIYGGFNQNDPDFKFRRSANVTTTVAAMGTVFDAPKIDQETHIEGITIEAAAMTVLKGSSTYGVRLGVGMGQLFVRYNIINVQAGADGVTGNSGAAPGQAVATNGQSGGNGCSNNNCQPNGAPGTQCVEFGGSGGGGGYDNQPGFSGAVGSGNTPAGGGGAQSPSCGTNQSKSGVDGSGGVSGNQGAPGSGGASLGIMSGGNYSPAGGGIGALGLNGKGGGGGGGGGGGLNKTLCNPDTGGGGGAGGCGGLGGNLGFGGGGGGGSFGVFAASGKVVVTGNTINTSKGGNGGKGGNGADGQIGGGGGGKGGGADDSAPGGLGGKGGDGGAGGPGGGGGGPSSCLARTGSVVFTFGMNSCTTGVPGFGGAAGTNNKGGVASPGNNGTAAANLQVN